MSQPLIILLIIAAYFLLMLAVARFVSRGADNSTFFIGNRKMPWPLVAMAMICAPISGVTFISVPGMVVGKGYGYLQMCMGFVVGYIVIALVLLPVFYRNKVISIYSYLGDRFGDSTYKTGAQLFLISKVLGTAVKFFVICAMMQLLVFQPLGLPFPLTVILTLTLIWFYTVAGGVKAVIWTDMLKCLTLIVSVGFCIYFVTRELGLQLNDIPDILASHETVRVFNFENPMEDSYFWKQFIGGIFLVVAMTGLDQEMMQHALSCRNARSSMKNMFVSSVMQCVVISLFLFLGTLLVMYAGNKGIPLPEKSDNLFGTLAFSEGMPLAVGILFVLGLVASTYSSLGSALTSLTTSYLVDITGADKKYEGASLARRRKITHAVIAAVMAVIIITFYYLSTQDAISAVFTLASYTYGPILGLFAFGLFTNINVNPKFIPAVCLASPFLSWAVQWWAKEYYDYSVGFELLLINASFTIIGLTVISMVSKPKKELA